MNKNTTKKTEKGFGDTYSGFIPRDLPAHGGLPAEDERVLPVDPDPSHAAILVVVVVTGRADARPQEAQVGEQRPHAQAEVRACQQIPPQPLNQNTKTLTKTS